MSLGSRLRAAARAFRQPGLDAPPTFPDWNTAQRLAFFWGLDDIRIEFPKAYRIVSTVRAVVDLLMNDIGALPIAFEQERGRDWSPIERRPGNIVDVWHAANPLESGYELARNEAASRLINGSSYLFLDRMIDLSLPQIGPVKELTILKGHMVEPVKGERRSILGYRWQSGARETLLPAESIVMVREFNSEDEAVGLSFLSAVKLQYESRYDLMRILQKILRNGGMPAGFFKPSSVDAMPMSEPAFEQFRKRMRERHQGIDKLGDPIVLEGLEWQRAGMTMDEMKFLDSVSITDADIAKAAKVPPWKIGVKEPGGLGQASASADERGYWENAVRPLVTLRDATYTEKLCTLFGDGIRMRTEFSGIPSLQEVQLQQAQKMVVLTGRPILTVNEARAKVGEPLSDDPSADVLAVPFTLAPLAGGGGGGALARVSRAAPRGDVEERRSREAVKLKTFEKWMEAAFRSMFDGQQERIIAKLRVLGEMGARARHRRFFDIDELLAEGFEGDQNRVREILAALIQARGQEALAEVALELGYRLTGGKAAAWLEAKTLRLLVLTSETTSARVRDSLVAGVAENEMLGQLVARVQEIFDGRRDNALTIARTESAAAYNFATFDAWEQSGVVEGKAWLTAQDDAVRDSHVAAEAQGVIPFHQDFDVGGFAMAYPLDPRGPAHETINCRCTIEPVISAARSAPRARAVMSRNGKPALPPVIVERLAGIFAEKR